MIMEITLPSGCNAPMAHSKLGRKKAEDGGR
jgi:hypothetical protein